MYYKKCVHVIISVKKKFETTKDILTWNLYKKARNELNNILKQSKRAYFRTNLDSAKNNPKKTWNLLNQLSSRNLNKCSNVNAVEFNGVEITDRHEVAEAFNTHFTEIGENLANNIPKQIIKNSDECCSSFPNTYI